MSNEPRDNNASDVATGEIVPPDTQLAKTQGSTVDELAQSESGVVIVERGIAIIKTLRAASIALTYPHDWVLFKAEDRVTAYCQDAGCQRFSDLWGIEIYDLGEWIHTKDEETGDFSWSIEGSGLSKRTGQVVVGIFGTRYSYEEFIVRRKLPKLQISTEVKKAARANLHGSIVRELAGMKQVPMEELDQVWATAGMGAYKTTKLSPRGRGFGTGNERAGGASADKNGGLAPTDIPMCDFCEPPVRLVYREKGNPPFWGCPQYTKHPSKKMTINHDELVKNLAARAGTTAPREPGQDG